MTAVDPDLVASLLGDTGGVLRLEPAFVARDFLPPGRRLGLPEDAYDVGDRGAICERWLASTTKADNRIGIPHEGLSTVRTDDDRSLLLRDAVAAAPELVMGASYAAAHPGGLGRLAKLFDYAYRLPYHVHPPQRTRALVGAQAKDEAYHFLRPTPDAPRNARRPSVARREAAQVLLPTSSTGTAT